MRTMFSTQSPKLRAPNTLGTKKNLMRQMIKRAKAPKMSLRSMKGLSALPKMGGRGAKMSVTSPKGLTGGFAKTGGAGLLGGMASASTFGDGGGANLGTTGIL